MKSKHQLKIAVAFLTVTFASLHIAWAQSQALQIPGSVPLDHSRPPATDIKVNGRVYLPDELTEYRKELAKKGLDLSDLNPNEETDLWRDEVGLPLNPKLDQMELDLSREVAYVKDLNSTRTGSIRFSAIQADADGFKRNYIVMPSKTAHTVLLRKNLLRKLGYRIPPILYAPQITVRFSSEFLKNAFVKQMVGRTLGNEERWVVADPALDPKILKLQDVLVFKEFPHYDLSVAYLEADQHIRGRRIMNAVIVPYALTNVQETVNGFDYVAGKKLGENNVLLNIADDGAFSTPLDDAIWILKRIAKLTRADFEEVVAHSHFPREVAAVLVEKLSARRNWLMEQFNLKWVDAKKTVAVQPLPVNPHITMAPDLIDGELKKEVWPGHAARYAFTDPESPLSPVEIRAFFKSKAISTALSAAVSRLDREFLPGTDIEKKIYNEQIAEAKDQFIHFLKTGKVEKTPFGFKTFPTFDADVLVSRDVIAGDYMGTDNMIQLADSFEVILKPGVLSSVRGLSPGYQLQLGAELRVSRSYSHLRNIKSIRRAIKEPFRNLLVSLLKKDTGYIFDEIFSPEFQALDGEERTEMLRDLMKQFNEAMGPGDSFIISNNIGLTGFVGGGYSLKRNIGIQASLNRTRMSVGRLHILKKGEYEIHIYKDRGDMNLTGFNMGLKAHIPVISFSFAKSDGKAKSKFYKFDLNPNIKANPDVEKNISAVRAALIDGSLELADAAQKPYLLGLGFEESSTGFTLLALNRFGVESTSRISIAHPEGATAEYVRSTHGRRQGLDYQGVAVDTINALLAEAFEEDEFTVPNPGSGDPGDTFNGHSSMRNASFEFELANSSGVELSPPFFRVDYRWHGWKLSPEKMDSLIKEVNAKFGYTMFNPLRFNNTEEYQLYAIDIGVYVYANALESILSIPDKTLKNLMLKEGYFPDIPIDGPKFHKHAGGGQPSQAERKSRAVDTTLKLRREYGELLRKGDKSEAVKRAVKFLSMIELVLPFHRFVELAGGSQNLFVYGQASGFRAGNENGDIPIIGDTFGQFPEERTRGGLDFLSTSMGISPGEFYFYWLMRKL